MTQRLTGYRPHSAYGITQHCHCKCTHRRGPATRRRVADGGLAFQLVALLEAEVRHPRQAVRLQSERIRQEVEDETVGDLRFCVHQQMWCALHDVQTRAAGGCEGGASRGVDVSGRAAGCGERPQTPPRESDLPPVKLACHSSAADTGEICNSGSGVGSSTPDPLREAAPGLRRRGLTWSSSPARIITGTRMAAKPSSGSGASSSQRMRWCASCAV